MREVGIVCENTSDITPAMARELDICVAPYAMILDDETHLMTLDVDRKQVIDRAAHCQKFSTSGVNINDFYVAYADMLERAKSLVVITLATELSVTYNSAVAATELVDNRTIKVYDSRGAYVATRTIVVEAARRALAGATLEEVCGFVEAAIPRAQTLAISPNLTFVRAIGRLTEGKDAAGREVRLAILRVKDGKVVPIDAAVDYDEAVEKVIDHAAEVVGKGSAIYGALSHVRQPEAAERLHGRIRESFRCGPLSRTEESHLGLIVGGVGMVGFGFCPVL